MPEKFANKQKKIKGIPKENVREKKSEAVFKQICQMRFQINMLEVLKRNPEQIVEWVTKETYTAIAWDIIRGIKKKNSQIIFWKNMTV